MCIRDRIKNIRMEVEKGEIMTLNGPNGAGKSTIFKSITRQLAILGGSVWVDGREMGQMSGKELARKQAVVLTLSLIHILPMRIEALGAPPLPTKAAKADTIRISGMHTPTPVSARAPASGMWPM